MRVIVRAMRVMVRAMRVKQKIKKNKEKERNKISMHKYLQDYNEVLD